MDTSLADLRSKIPTARDSRRQIAGITPSYRLFHGAVDGIAGLEIDVFNRDVFYVRTRNAKTDSFIPSIAEVLRSDFQARTVWLKNQFPGRAAQGLELSDRVLFGPVTDNAVPIEDAGFRFRWDWNREETFPLEDRPLRSGLNRHLAANNACRSVLCAGFETAAIVASEYSEATAVAVDTRGLKIADATQLLRDLADARDRFDALALDFTFVHNIEKNKTALFHFWNAVYTLLDPAAPLFVKTAHAEELVELLAAIARKKGRTLRVMKMETADGDFPALAGKGRPPFYYVTARMGSY